MPSPLNTPTSENIPHSIFDTVVDIDLDEKLPRPLVVSKSAIREVTTTTTATALSQSSSSPSSSSSPASSSKPPNSASATGEQDHFFSCLGSNGHLSKETFSPLSGSSSSNSSKFATPAEELEPCDELSTENRSGITVGIESATPEPPALEADGSADNSNSNTGDSNGPELNTLKTNLTLAFNSELKLNDTTFPAELNTGSIRCRRARLHLKLSMNSPTTQQEQAKVDGPLGRSVDSVDGSSGSSSVGPSSATISTNGSINTESTESISSASGSGTNSAAHHLPMISPASAGPKSAPIPLSLTTALTINTGCTPLNQADQQQLPILQRRKRPVFNFYLNKSANAIDTVRVDTKMPLERQGWFHGFINRVDAEMLLHSTKVGSYLVRKCDQRKKVYSLSIRSVRGYMHIRIFQHQETGRYTLGTTCSEYFESIPELVDHFTANRLPISGAEHMSLIYPVIAQLL